jgi:Putative adhesin
MSVRTHVAAVPGPPPRIEVRNAAGSVTVAAVEGAEQLEVRVEPLDAAADELLDRVEIDVRDAESDDVPTRLRVVVPERRLLRTPSFAVRITTPPGAAARIGVASADVELTGRFGDLELTSASGDLDVEHGAEVRVRTASGETRVGAIDARASVASASGDVRIGRASGDLQVRTASGDASVEQTAGHVTISTASGDATVGAASGGAVQVKTVSGDASVGVVPGLRVWLDLSSVSGRLGSQLDDDGDAADGPAGLSLTMRSVSGDMRIHRTAAAPVS